MTNVQIRCCHCGGSGQVADYRVVNGKIMEGAIPLSTSYTFVGCPTCLGWGIVIATELKAVVSWEPIHGTPPVAEKPA